MVGKGKRKREIRCMPGRGVCRAKTLQKNIQHSRLIHHGMGMRKREGKIQRKSIFQGWDLEESVELGHLYQAGAFNHSCSCSDSKAHHWKGLYQHFTSCELSIGSASHPPMPQTFHSPLILQIFILLTFSLDPPSCLTSVNWWLFGV